VLRAIAALPCAEMDFLGAAGCTFAVRGAVGVLGAVVRVADRGCGA